jgi:hypothetical protein
LGEGGEILKAGEVWRTYGAPDFFSQRFPSAFALG